MELIQSHIHLYVLKKESLIFSYDKNLSRCEDFDLWIRYFLNGSMKIKVFKNPLTNIILQGLFKKDKENAKIQIKIRLKYIQKFSILIFILILGIVPNIFRLIFQIIFFYFLGESYRSKTDKKFVPESLAAKKSFLNRR